MAEAGAFLSRWRFPPNHLAVVTGGNSGIGLAVAKELVDLGAEVLIIGRDSDKTKKVSEDLGCFAYACDVTSEAEFIKLDMYMREDQKMRELEFGTLVNCAGMNVRASFEDTSELDYHRIMALNVDAPYKLCQLFARCSRGANRSVINVSSLAGVTSTGSGAVYGMSKAALISLTKTLACEWAKQGVRVNAIAPWVTYTPMLMSAIAQSEHQRNALQRAESATPLGRAAHPHEIAATVAFLALPAASYITGQTINIDGGISIEGFAGPCVVR